MLSIRVLKPKVVRLFKIAFCNEGKVEIKLVPVNFLGFLLTGLFRSLANLFLPSYYSPAELKMLLKLVSALRL